MNAGVNARERCGPPVGFTCGLPLGSTLRARSPCGVDRRSLSGVDPACVVPHRLAVRWAATIEEQIMELQELLLRAGVPSAYHGQGHTYWKASYTCREHRHLVRASTFCGRHLAILVRASCAAGIDILRKAQVEENMSVKSMNRVLVEGCGHLQEGVAILKKVLELTK